MISGANENWVVAGEIEIRSSGDEESAAVTGRQQWLGFDSRFQLETIIIQVWTRTLSCLLFIHTCVYLDFMKRLLRNPK